MDLSFGIRGNIIPPSKGPFISPVLPDIHTGLEANKPHSSKSRRLKSDGKGKAVQCRLFC